MIEVSRETLPAPLTSDDFARVASVSRETLDRLKVYEGMLRRWQSRMNLVAPASLIDPWRRHFLDSAQLQPLLPDPPSPLVDLGSGAGFPGLVLAILGISPVTLVESNARKCAFLREVARATETSLEIFAGRIETFHPRPLARVVTARALAPLEKLLSLAAPLLAAQGLCLFLKGEQVERELTVATKTWKISIERIRSLSDDQATILKIQGLASHDS